MAHYFYLQLSHCKMQLSRAMSETEDASSKLENECLLSGHLQSQVTALSEELESQGKELARVLEIHRGTTTQLSRLMSEEGEDQFIRGGISKKHKDLKEEYKKLQAEYQKILSSNGMIEAQKRNAQSQQIETLLAEKDQLQYQVDTYEGKFSSLQERARDMDLELKR